MSSAKCATIVGVTADSEPQAGVTLDDDVEVVDAEPVAIEYSGGSHGAVTEPARRSRLLALVPPRVAQAAALTLSGFAAGALTTIIRRRSGGGKQLARRKRGSRAGGKIVASHSFVVDVHLLDRR